MNRHGISLNPTAEQSALLRRLWRADDAQNRALRALRDVKYWQERALEAEARLRAAEEQGVTQVVTRLDDTTPHEATQGDSTRSL